MAYGRLFPLGKQNCPALANARFQNLKFVDFVCAESGENPLRIVHHAVITLDEGNNPMENGQIVRLEREPCLNRYNRSSLLFLP